MITTTFQRAALCLATLPLVVGCSADVAGPPIDDTPPTAFELLQQQQELDMLPDATWVDMLARIDRGSEWIERNVRMPVNRGNVLLSADDYGEVTVDGLAIAFDDVTAGAGLISPKGLHFTEIVARLDAPITCSTSRWDRKGQRCNAEATLELSLEWSLVVDGRVYPLGDQHLGQMVLDIQVYQHDRKLYAVLEGTAEGVFWEWANIVEFADLTLYTTAGQPGPIVD